MENRNPCKYAKNSCRTEKVCFPVLSQKSIFKYLFANFKGLKFDRMF